jgi:2-polyprenyl-3-methyl-5-hydroxy-6-metoxy-1,4-benzoquinol methylase
MNRKSQSPDVISALSILDDVWYLGQRHRDRSKMKYYHFVRREIEPLLPKDATRILDVGAGAGTTLQWVKTFFPKAETTGVELNPEMRGELGKNADVALIGDIDDCLFKLKTYNLILLLDVLEHLKDSTGTLQKLSRLLEPGGHVIVSVPNLAHFSVSLPLLLKRRFDYQDAGILDRTHLRFFVEDTAIKLLNDAHLIVRKGLILGLQGPKTRLLDSLSFGLLRHHLAKQYVMLGQLSDGELVQQDLRWIVAR